MICQYCNKQIEDRIKFCTYCGKKIEVPVIENLPPVIEKNACKTCGYPLDVNMKFCVKCGTRTEKDSQESQTTEYIIEEKKQEITQKDTVKEVQEPQNIEKDTVAETQKNKITKETEKAEQSSRIKISFCMRCGKQLGEGNKFCNACGTPVKNLPMSNTLTGNTQRLATTQIPETSSQSLGNSSTKPTPKASGNKVLVIVLIVLLLVFFVTLIFVGGQILQSKTQPSTQIGMLVGQATEQSSEITNQSSEEQETVIEEQKTTTEELTYNLDENNQISLQGVVYRKGTKWIVEWEQAASVGKTNDDGEMIRVDKVTDAVIDIAELPQKMMDTIPSNQTLTISGTAMITGGRLIITPSEIFDVWGNELISSYESANEDDYILPQSDSVLLTEADIAGLTLREINYAKNEIYARHGRKFMSKELREYFESKSWYEPRISAESFDAGRYLSDLENKNAAFLSEVEERMGTYQLDQ